MQYIAYGEMTIEPNGDLRREAVIKAGMIDPGEKFWVCFIISSSKIIHSIGS